MKLLKCLGDKGVVSQLNTGQIIVGKEGERLLRRLDFYTAFVAPVDFDVINSEDSKRVGMVQTIPEVNHQLILAGKRWVVERIDEKSKNIFVKRIKTGGSITYISDVPEVDELITRKMRDIYISEEMYPYIDTASSSNQELIKAREYFMGNKLNINFYAGRSLFTWAGAKINRTITLMLKKHCGRSVDYNHLMIFGITPDDIAQILSQPKPNPDDLAALVPRTSKEKQQYDHYLSEELLNHEYACTYLDVDKAWEELQKLQNAGGYQNEDDDITVYDFRHIKDISNVVPYETLSDPLNEVFKQYLQDNDLGCTIETGVMLPGAPAHAMPVNFLLTKGGKKLAVLLLDCSKVKRYSVQETHALCEENGIEAIRFYFECDNEEEYVVERIKDHLS